MHQTRLEGAADGQEMYPPVVQFGPGMEGHVIKCVHGTVCLCHRQGKAGAAGVAGIKYLVGSLVNVRNLTPHNRSGGGAGKDPGNGETSAFSIFMPLFISALGLEGEGEQQCMDERWQFQP